MNAEEEGEEGLGIIIRLMKKKKKRKREAKERERETRESNGRRKQPMRCGLLQSGAPNPKETGKLSKCTILCSNICVFVFVLRMCIPLSPSFPSHQ